jgi:hypothetical protein
MKTDQSKTETPAPVSSTPLVRRRPTGVSKTLNLYATSVAGYNDIPEAVWAAIAVSKLTCGGEYLTQATEIVVGEWRILHENGIVPQKPPNDQAHV